MQPVYSQRVFDPQRACATSEIARLGIPNQHPSVRSFMRAAVRDTIIFRQAGVGLAFGANGSLEKCTAEVLGPSRLNELIYVHSSPVGPPSLGILSQL